MGAKKKPLETLSAADAGVDAGRVGGRRRAERRPLDRAAGGEVGRRHDRGLRAATRPSKVVEILAGKGLI